MAFHRQADLLVFELESLHLNCTLQKRLQFKKTLFSRSLLGEAEQIADEFASAPGLLADFLSVGELLAAEVAAGRHAFGTAQDGRERVLQFSGRERHQFSERSQFGLLDNSSLQPLEIVEALARMIEQLQKSLVQQVLFQEDDKGQDGDAAHSHRKTDLAQIRLLFAHEQCPVSHDGEREQGEFGKFRSDGATGTSDRRHHLDIAKAAPAGDGDPEERKRSGEKRDVVDCASLIGAACDGGIYAVRRKCVESTGEKNVAIKFAPRSGTGEESQC